MMSYKLLQIIWILTEVFFILSLLLLFIFFILKKIFDIKRGAHSKESISTKELHQKKYALLKTKQEIISYAKSIGELLINTEDPKKRIALKKYIQEIHLYPKIYSFYKKTNYNSFRLYFLSVIVPLSQEESRKLYYSILSDTETKDIPQFYIFATFGLALSSKNEDDLTSLYHIVSDLESKKNITQKLAQFFFTEAFKSMESSIYTSFLLHFTPEKPTTTLNALIYALQNVPINKQIEIKLLQWHEDFPNNAMLLISILRVLYTHKRKHPELILKHHNDHEDLIRIVCAKVGIDMLPKEKLGILTHYLCDKNIHVRKNFLIALAEHSITYDAIYHLVMQYYPKCLNAQQPCSSLEAYKKGII